MAGSAPNSQSKESLATFPFQLGQGWSLNCKFLLGMSVFAKLTGRASAMCRVAQKRA
jgi:hypothetical protein